MFLQQTLLCQHLTACHWPGQNVSQPGGSKGQHPALRQALAVPSEIIGASGLLLHLLLCIQCMEHAVLCRASMLLGMSQAQLSSTWAHCPQPLFHRPGHWPVRDRALLACMHQPQHGRHGILVHHVQLASG